MENRYAALLRTFSRKTYLHLLIIAFIGFAAYSNTFLVPFEFDDFDLIENNLMIRSLDNFLLALKGHDFASSAYQYTPARFVGYFSFALNYYFGGVDVRGYHIVNLLIHIGNAFLVYFFVMLTFRTPYFNCETLTAKRERSAVNGEKSGNPRFTFHNSRLFAFVVALLFVSHPLQTQAVTYIVQRFASLATFFYLLSVVMYVKGRLVSRKKGETGGLFPNGPALFFFLVSLASAVLAMRTKEIAYTLPLVLILYEATFFNASLRKKLLLFIVPVVLILIIVSIGVIRSDKPLGEILSHLDSTMRAETKMPRWDYLMTEMPVIATYIRLIFLPVNQNLDYDYPIYHSFSDLPVLLSFLFLSAIFAVAVYLLYKSSWAAMGYGQEDKNREQGVALPGAYGLPPVAYLRLAAFGIFWFFITLSVESSIIPIKDVISEHRVYLPSVGFFISIAAGMCAVAARFKKEQGIALILFLIIPALSAATYARNNIWKDRVTLWEDIVKKSPNLARPHTGLGAVYLRQGRLDDAMREFQTAVSLNPSDYVAHYNIGLLYWQQGRLDEAKNEFQAAAWLRPDNADIHNALGRAYEQKGFLHDAMREYQTAVRLNPDLAGARANLAALSARIRGK